MEKLRGFNLVYLAMGQRNASRDSDVPGMKKVEAFRPKCRCRHSAHWFARESAHFYCVDGRGNVRDERGRLSTGGVVCPPNPGHKNT
jgi:hypothetical protein